MEPHESHIKAGKASVSRVEGFPAQACMNPHTHEGSTPTRKATRLTSSSHIYTVVWEGPKRQEHGSQMPELGPFAIC